MDPIELRRLALWIEVGSFGLASLWAAEAAPWLAIACALEVAGRLRQLADLGEPA